MLQINTQWLELRYILFSRWTAVVTATTAYIVMFVCALYAVVERHSVGAALAGLIISYALQVRENQYNAIFTLSTHK